MSRAEIIAATPPNASRWHSAPVDPNDRARLLEMAHAFNELAAKAALQNSAK